MSWDNIPYRYMLVSLNVEENVTINEFLNLDFQISASAMRTLLSTVTTKITSWSRSCIYSDQDIPHVGFLDELYRI